MEHLVDDEKIITITMEDMIKILFPNGKYFYMSGSDIAEILCQEFEIKFNPIISDCDYIFGESSNYFKSLKEIAKKYEEGE